jgi:hypothetical protein
MPAEPAMPGLVARLGELAQVVSAVSAEIRLLAAQPDAPHRERRLAALRRELDVIAAEAARIERRL